MAAQLKWRLYQSKIADLHSGLRAVPPQILFPQGAPPQMPEAYTTYCQVKRWGRLWWTGDLADQPHLLQAELDACAAGEAQFRDTDLPQLEQLETLNGPQRASANFRPSVPR